MLVIYIIALLITILVTALCSKNIERYTVDGNTLSTDNIVSKTGSVAGVIFNRRYSGWPNNRADAAEISNDTGTYRKLMIVGNKAAGENRKVGIWDELTVHGKLRVTGGTDITGRGGHHGDKTVYSGRWGDWKDHVST